MPHSPPALRRRRIEACVSQRRSSTSQQLDPKLVAQTRHGRRNRYARRPGHFPVDQILQSVQIDHALADIIVVDERDRLSIGRPWLTLAVDIFSRSILGFYVSLDSPAVTSIGLSLTQACLPKQPWLHARDLDLEWPMCDLPDVLRADNGKDFRSDALQRGCREHASAWTSGPLPPRISVAISSAASGQ